MSQMQYNQYEINQKLKELQELSKKAEKKLLKIKRDKQLFGVNKNDK